MLVILCAIHVWKQKFGTLLKVTVVSKAKMILYFGTEGVSVKLMPFVLDEIP